MTNNIKALAEEYSSLDEMNADREITDPGELAQIAKLDAMRKAAAPLAVCTALLESEGETIRADVFLDRFFPGYEKMPMGLRVVTMHLRYLATDGFITFKADGDETILTLLHEQFVDEAARDGHNSGWTQALDKLAAHFA